MALRSRFCSKGFTLLEILFVLLITGLMIAMVGPRFGGRIDDYKRSYQFQSLEDDLRYLPRRVRLVAMAVELPADLEKGNLEDGHPIVELPAGWTMEATPPLRISPLGACSAARIRFIPDDGGEARTYDVGELTCELNRANE